MIKGYRYYVIACGFMLLLCALAVNAPAAIPASGRVPEKLIYNLSWTGIPVGVATQEITEDDKTRQIVSTARSNPWLSAFFPVDDRTESTLGKNGPYPGEPRHFKMLFKEGSRTRSREITFNRAAGVARFHDIVGGEQVDVPIGADAMDIYSSFYFVRHQSLKPGESIYLNVMDSKELHHIEVRVLRKERIKVPAGVFNTVVVEPMVKPVGVFEGKRGAYIWITDDERRIPVKAQTKVKVGSVTAELTGGNY